MFRELPPLSQLRAFAALAEAGGMSAAGALLNVSHAAIGQQVRALEERLGVQLFVREGRGIALTAEGQRLGGVLRDAFGTIAREIDDLTGSDADRPLQITTTPSFAARWLMPRLGSFRAQHPEIDLMLNPSADVIELTPGGVELAVRFGKGDWKGLESQMFLRTPFVITAARSLIGDRTIDSPAELLDFPWLQEIGTDEAKEWLTGQGVTEGRVRNMTSLPGNLLQDALRSGEGVAATALAFVEREVENGDIVVLFQDDGRGPGYFLVTRPGVQRPALRAFMRWLMKEAQAGA
ncbi:LysR family transcriptional regulator [Psychromarinibacter sp. S121]|uniref:LysR family transcriptional regulator n=1 Tax=Psychromarinibacter sp. S121 TaxID=3415127 RepID=UPI003C799C5F